ncbi:hypothetical protein XM68_c20719 [Vibrio alginolyticus]|nr:hypothetical protein XM68_c20719 [Vibrio alginolyticus]
MGLPLWGLAERDIAGFTGFNYSEAIKQHQGQWDAEKLDAFLASPPEFAPGTNMVFPGVKDPGARAAIIAWLATQNPTRHQIGILLHLKWRSNQLVMGY